MDFGTGRCIGSAPPIRAETSDTTVSPHIEFSRMGREITKDRSGAALRPFGEFTRITFHVLPHLHVGSMKRKFTLEGGISFLSTYPKIMFPDGWFSRAHFRKHYPGKTFCHQRSCIQGFLVCNAWMKHFQPCATHEAATDNLATASKNEMIENSSCIKNNKISIQPACNWPFCLKQERSEKKRV